MTTESVWDYPRPPRVEASDEHVVVEHAGVRVVETRAALRVLETSHPPGYYVPMSDVLPGALRPARSRRRTVCEFKGQAVYHDLVVVGADGQEVVVHDVGWSYPAPVTGYEALVDHVALYPGRVDRCLVNGEVVTAQEGGFYGGWITARIQGPFKGAPGTGGW